MAQAAGGTQMLLFWTWHLKIISLPHLALHYFLFKSYPLQMTTQLGLSAVWLLMLPGPQPGKLHRLSLLRLLYTDRHYAAACPAVL
jgi:hypothetical protein